MVWWCCYYIGGCFVASWVLAPNVAQVNRDVRGTSFLTDLGTIGDTSHQQGAGDHTPWSSHVGKFGYPTQGEVHAQDIGGSEYYLDLLETFVRRSWRRGELGGLKYINVLNRHWNVQSWASFEKARAGTLKSTYSGDHHVHLSFENGGVDGDLVERFRAWLDAGQEFGGVEDMATADEIANAVVQKLAYADFAWGVSVEPDDGVNTQSNQNRWAAAAHSADAANVKAGQILEQIGVGGTDPEVLRQVVREELLALLQASSRGELDALGG